MDYGFRREYPTFFCREKAAEQRNKESEGKSVRVNNLGFYSFEGSTPRSSSGLKSTAQRET